MRAALHASHADKCRDHEEAVRRHQAEYKGLQERIKAMYVDKLDGVARRVLLRATLQKRPYLRFGWGTRIRT